MRLVSTLSLKNSFRFALNGSISLITVQQHMMHLRANSNISRAEVTTCTLASLSDGVFDAAVTGGDWPLEMYLS